MELTQADYDLNDVVGGIVLPSPVARLLHIPANQSAESADMAWPLYMGNNVVCRGDPQPFDFSAVLLGPRLQLPFYNISLASQYVAAGFAEPKSVSRTHAVLTVTRGQGGKLMLDVSGSGTSVSLVRAEAAGASSSSAPLWKRCVQGIPEPVREGTPFIMGAEHFLWQMVPGSSTGWEDRTAQAAAPASTTGNTTAGFPAVTPEQASAAVARTPAAHIPLGFQVTLLEETGAEGLPEHDALPLPLPIDAGAASAGGVNVSPIVAPGHPHAPSPVLPSLPLADFGSQSQSQQHKRQSPSQKVAAVGAQAAQDTKQEAPVVAPATLSMACDPSESTDEELDEGGAAGGNQEAVDSVTLKLPPSSRAVAEGSAPAPAPPSSSAGGAIFSPVSPGIAATQVVHWEPTQASPSMTDDSPPAGFSSRRLGYGSAAADDDTEDEEGTQLHSSPGRGHGVGHQQATGAGQVMPMYAAPDLASRAHDDLLEDMHGHDTSRVARETIRSRYALPHAPPQVLSNPHEIASLDDAYDAIDYGVGSAAVTAAEEEVPAGVVAAVAPTIEASVEQTSVDDGEAAAAPQVEQEDEAEEALLPPPAKRARLGSLVRGETSTGATEPRPAGSPSTTRTRLAQAQASAAGIRVAFTLFDKKEEAHYAEIVKMLGGQVVSEVVSRSPAAASSSSFPSEDDYVPQCTHIVCPRVGSSAKFLEALCVCPWIVSGTWLDESHAKGSFIELSPDTVAPYLPPASKTKLVGCPPIEDLHKLIKRRTLPCRPLVNVSFFLLPGFCDASRPQLVDVIRLCGGRVLTELPQPESAGAGAPAPPMSPPPEPTLGQILQQPPLLTRRRAAIRALILAPPDEALTDEARELLEAAYDTAPKSKGRSSMRAAKAKGGKAAATGGGGPGWALPPGVLLCRSSLVRQCIFHLSLSEQVVKANRLTEEAFVEACEATAGAGGSGGGSGASRPRGRQRPAKR